MRRVIISPWCRNLIIIFNTYVTFRYQIRSMTEKFDHSVLWLLHLACKLRQMFSFRVLSIYGIRKRSEQMESATVNVARPPSYVFLKYLHFKLLHNIMPYGVHTGCGCSTPSISRKLPVFPSTNQITFGTFKKRHIWYENVAWNISDIKL